MRRRDPDTGIIAGVVGVGCLMLVLQVALYAAIIFAIIKLVLHFT